MIQPVRGLVKEALTEQGWTIGATVVDDGGGGARGTAIAGGTVACRIDSLASRGESSVADRISDRSTHLLTLPVGTEVTTEEQFYVSGRGTYEITAVHEHTDELTTVIEVVERV